MIDQADSRQFVRTVEFGELSYKFPDDEQIYTAECLKVSGAVVLFRTEQALESGIALEVTIVAHNALASSMIAYVEVVRCKGSQAGGYEIATEIKGIKEY